MTSSMRRKAYSDGKTDRLGDLSRSARVRPIAVPRALLAAFVVIALVAGCSARAGERIKIGVAMPAIREERWARDLEAMTAKAGELGVDIRVAVSGDDQSQQNAQVEQLLAQGIDVLILSPYDGEGAAMAVKKAHEEGVKVVSYDRLVMGCDVDLYLSFDNILVGECQGRWLVGAVPKGVYVVMSGAPVDNNAALFREGAMRHIQPFVDRGDVRVVLDQPIIDWLPDNARAVVENALALADGSIDAILAPNDGAAGGAAAALAARGLAGKVAITGQDADLAAARRIVRGEQGMTVFKDTRLLGEEAVRLALKLAKGEDAVSDAAGRTVDNEFMAVPSVLLSPFVVDRANLDAALIESGYLAREDVYDG